MLEALRRPLPLPHLAAGALAATLLVALYCVAYTSLAGRPETLGVGLAWAAANVAPWLIAIEVGKRAAGWPQVGAVLAGALITSLAIGYAAQVSDDSVATEQALADHGFVRIHRSTLVRRDRIARVRPEDVVLADGTHLKIGKRYRASLAA